MKSNTAITMQRRLTQRKRLTLLGVLLATCQSVHPFTYATNVRLQDLVETTKISGFKGTDVVLSASEPNHAVYGVSSRERRDSPCLIELRTENLNDYADHAAIARDWCGGEASSSGLPLEYADIGINQPRLFVSGIRLCMNRSSRRLKGYQISGKRISDTGSSQEIPVGNRQLFLFGGGGSFNRSSVSGTPDFPVNVRTNCSDEDWMPWASCSRPNQVASGIVVHVSAGKSPRSITGIALRCQIVSAIRL